MKRLALALAAASVLVLTAPAHAAVIHEWQGDGNANDSVGTNNARSLATPRSPPA
jgi:hypothetical protein